MPGALGPDPREPRWAPSRRRRSPVSAFLSQGAALAGWAEGREPRGPGSAKLAEPPRNTGEESRPAPRGNQKSNSSQERPQKAGKGGKFESFEKYSRSRRGRGCSAGPCRQPPLAALRSRRLPAAVALPGSVLAGERGCAATQVDLPRPRPAASARGGPKRAGPGRAPARSSRWAPGLGSAPLAPQLGLRCAAFSPLRAFHSALPPPTSLPPSLTPPSSSRLRVRSLALPPFVARSPV